MKRNNSQSFKEALGEFLKSNHLERKWSEEEVKQKWGQLLGPMVENRTTAISIKNGIMYVTLSSAALRQELSMSKSKIVSALNEEMGHEVLKDIVLK